MGLPINPLSQILHTLAFSNSHACYFRLAKEDNPDGIRSGFIHFNLANVRIVTNETIVRIVELFQVLTYFLC